MTDSPGHSRAPIGARRIAWWAAGAAIALSALVGAYIQGGRAYPLATVASITELRWWLEPFQRNGFLRLPSVRGTIDGLSATPDGQTIFALVSGQELARSADGGRTWETTKLAVKPGDNLKTVFLLDANRGWISGHDVLFKTTDGGRTWTHHAVKAPGDFKAIAFVDDKQAWGLTFSGQFGATTDGGVNWTLLDGAGAKMIGARKIAAMKRAGQNGWLLAQDGTVFATSTGGQQWQELPRLPLPTSASQASVRPPSRPRLTQLQTEDPDLAVQSTMGGGTFTLHEDTEPLTIEAGAEGSLLVWFDDGSARQLAAGAQEWKTFHSPQLSSGVASQLVPLADGSRLLRVAAGSGGLFRIDPVLGRTRLLLGEMEVFTAADIDGGSGAGPWWLIGGFDVVLRSDDQGRTWKPQSAGAPFDRFLSTVAVEFVDRELGWLASADGGVYRTTNGGRTWSPTTKPGVTPFVALHAISTTEGVALEEHGLVFETTDGGVTWRARGGSPLARARTLAGSGTLVRTVDDAGKVHRLSATMTNWEPETIQLPKTEWWYRYYRDLGSGGTLAQAFRGPVISRSMETEPFKPRHPQVFLFATFQAAGRIGLGVTPNRGVLRTADGGQTWQVAPLPALVIPAPWYWLTWLAVAFCFWRARQIDPSLQNIEDSIAARAIADAPIGRFDHDVLGLGEVARGLSRFFRNRDTKGPFTVAVSGAWGSGKTSFMRLLHDDLVVHGVRPVWFNAWHQQHEEHYLPVLLEGIVSQAVPPAWLPGGWGFRGRLWWGRILANWRQVFALLLLMTFSWALLTRPDAQQFLDRATVRAGEIWTTVSALVSGGEKAAAAASAPDTAKTSGADTAKTTAAKEASNVGWTIVASGLAGSVIALLRIFYSAFTAFGVNPAELLSRAASTRNKDVTARMSFQRRFARDFSEVTTALGAVPLVIFIDDLDRCKPEKTVEMLEAVNFLVASGSCFVVMGLATEQVEASVGLGYSNIAAELAAHSPGSSASEQRRQFARNYLEKLVNLSIPIPAPTDEQVAELLAGREDDKSEDEKQAEAARRKSFWWTLDELVRTKLPMLTQRTFEITLCLGLFVAAWQGGRRIAADEGTVIPAAPAASIPAVTDDPGAGSAQAGDATAKKAADSKKNDDRTARLEVVSGPMLITHGRADTGSLGLLVLALAAIAVSLAGLMMQRGRDITRDSPHFARALRYWSPVIERSHATPRALKRFINGVRYLAMQQTPEVMRTSLLERGVAWGAKKFGGHHLPTRTRGDTAARVKEDILVALASLEAFARAGKKAAFTAGGVDGVYDAAGDVLAAAKRDELTQKYPRFKLDASVEQYRQLTATARRREAG